MKFKVGYTEQAKAWTASVTVEGEDEELVKTTAIKLADEAKRVSKRLTFEKIRG